MSSSSLPTSPEEAREILSKLRDRVDNLFADVVEMETVQVEHTEAIAELQAENDRLQKELEEAKATAEQAMVIASRGHDPDSLSKVEQAKRIARNELIRRTANQIPPSKRPVTVQEVQEMGRPDVDFAYQTVKDAFNQLPTEHHAFRDTTKDGDRALSIDRGEITKSLTRRVEADLGRDDLTKKLITDETVGGGSE